MAQNARQLHTEFINYLIVEKGSSINTVYTYRRELQVFVEWLEFENMDIDDINVSNAGDYLWYLKKVKPEASPNTINHYLVVARNAMEFAITQGYVKTNYLGLVSGLKTQRRAKDTITDDQAHKIAVNGTDPDSNYYLRDRAILYLMYATGMRVSEICDLDVECYDPTEQMILVKSGKGNKDRLVPVGDNCCMALNNYLHHENRVGQKGFLFRNRFGGRITRKSLFMIVKTATHKAGVRGVKVSPHTLRHACATTMLKGGADLLVIRDMLGHSSITTTEKYLHNDIGDLKRAMALHPRATKSRKKRGS